MGVRQLLPAMHILDINLFKTGLWCSNLLQHETIRFKEVEPSSPSSLVRLFWSLPDFPSAKPMFNVTITFTCLLFPNCFSLIIHYAYTQNPTVIQHYSLLIPPASHLLARMPEAIQRHDMEDFDISPGPRLLPWNASSNIEIIKIFKH